MNHKTGQHDKPSAAERVKAAAANVLDKVTGKHHENTQQTKDNTYTTTTTREGAALHDYNKEHKDKTHEHHNNPLTHDMNTKTGHGRTHLQEEGHTYNPVSTTTATGATLPGAKDYHPHDNKPAGAIVNNPVGLNVAPGAHGGPQNQHTLGNNNTSNTAYGTQSTHDNHPNQGFTYNKDTPTATLAGAPEHQVDNLTNPRAVYEPGTNRIVGAPNVINPAVKDNHHNTGFNNTHTVDPTTHRQTETHNLNNPHAGIVPGTNEIVGAPNVNPEIKSSTNNDRHNNYNHDVLTNPHAGILPGTNQIVGAPIVNPAIKDHYENTHSNITHNPDAAANAPSGNITGTHRQHPVNTESVPGSNDYAPAYPLADTHGQQPAQPVTEGVRGPKFDHPTATKLGHHHDETKLGGKIQNAGHDAAEKVIGFDHNKQDNRPTI